MPGVTSSRRVMSVIPARCMARWSRAVTETPTSCRFCSRFCAVTMTSSRTKLCASAAPGSVPARASARPARRTGTVRVLRAAAVIVVCLCVVCGIGGRFERWCRRQRPAMIVGLFRACQTAGQPLNGPAPAPVACNVEPCASIGPLRAGPRPRSLQTRPGYG